jgi:hypothetical protein
VEVSPYPKAFHGIVRYCEGERFANVGMTDLRARRPWLPEVEVDLDPIQELQVYT